MPKMYARSKSAESEVIMAYTIISVKEQQGEYQGRQYHNFIVFGLNPDSSNPQVIVGSEVEQMKIKADTFVAVLNRNFGAMNNPNIKTVKDILGLYIVPIYNKFGGVEDFTLAVPDKKK